MNHKHLVQMALQRQQAIRSLEAQLEAAKEDFCQAVRELYLSGVSLREVATTLRLSHQRIHQIVEEGNKRAHSWLRPVSPDLRCSFCGRSSEQVSKLVAGPDMCVCLCDICANSCSEVLRTGTPIEGGSNSFRLLDRTQRLRCSFCDKLPGGRRSIIAGNEHRICAICLEITLKHMSKDNPAPSQNPGRTLS
jgi:hypothetical protein